jgi:hypothetical protein
MEEKSFKSEFNADYTIQGSESSEPKRPVQKQKQKRVIVDFPGWMLESLDIEANRIGVTRQSIIKLWLAENLAGERKLEEKRRRNI